MTVSTTSVIAGPYAGNNLNNTYSYPFGIDTDAEIAVYETDNTGVTSLLTLTVDYTVNRATKTVTRVAGVLPTGYEWYLRSNITPVQATSFAGQGKFYPALHEAAFDKLTLLYQQLKDVTGRVLRLSSYDGSGTSTELPKPAGGMAFGWDVSGTAIINYALQTGTSLVDLAAATGSSLIGFIQTATGSVIRTVKSKLSDHLDLFDFMTSAQIANVQSFAFTTDVSVPVQAAINWLSNNPNKHIKASAGGYLLNENIYAIYDVILNPNFNSSSLLGGGITVEGDGKMSRYDYKNATYQGTVFKFNNNKGLVTSNAGAQKTWNQHWTKLSVIGDTTGILWNAGWSPQWSVYDSLFVGNSNTSTTGTAFMCGDSWISTFSNMEVVGRSDLTVGTSGEGFVFQPSTSGGGNNLFLNITGAYFGASAVRFGGPYSATYKDYIQYWSTNNKVINCQGQYSADGVKFQHRFGDSIIENTWGEQNTNADVTVNNSCTGLKFIKGSFRSNTATTTALIVLGGNSGSATTDACTNISFDGSFFFCNVAGGTNYIPGVRRYKSALDIRFKRCKVYNGGSSFVVVDSDDVPGEVVFEDNNYFPIEASSELSPSRRYVYMPTSSTFTDYSYNLRRADFVPKDVPVASFNMSACRYVPELIRTNTIGNPVTLLLPQISGASGRKVTSTIIKPYGANTVTIDAGAGYTIKGAQTATLTPAYSCIKIQHSGSGNVTWDVLGN